MNSVFCSWLTSVTLTGSEPQGAETIIGWKSQPFVTWPINRYVDPPGSCLVPNALSVTVSTMKPLTLDFRVL